MSNDDQERHLEVKGVSSSMPSVLLTRKAVLAYRVSPKVRR